MTGILISTLAFGILTNTFIMDIYQKIYPDIIFKVDTEKKMVALSLDDTPDAEQTPQLLDLLNEYDCTATFFVIGKRVPGNEKILHDVLRGGNELGNHMMSFTTTYLLGEEAFRKRVLATEKLIPYFKGEKLFRPPSGLITKKQIKILEKMGYKCVLGDLYYFDANITMPYTIGKLILRDLRPGSIIILHDGKGTDKRRQSLKILEYILPKIKARGYEVVTVSELLKNAK